jgi:multidrug efflux pump subunit AcrB
MSLVFHERTKMSQAMSETVGYVNRARSFMPPGTVPPFITRFDAGSVAVGQLVFRSDTHSQGEVQDFAINRVRPLFATLPGVSAPPPFGGNQRTIVVTLDPDKLRQYRISPEEAIAAVSESTLVMASGNMWTGKVERIARTNAALGSNLADLLSTPIRPVSGPSVYLRDIGTIENGTDIVSADAHVNGKRTVYIPVTKRADASTSPSSAPSRPPCPNSARPFPKTSMSASNSISRLTSPIPSAASSPKASSAPPSPGSWS